MPELWTNTIKYYRLAIGQFLPELEHLYSDHSPDAATSKKIRDLIEIYKDVAKKIDKYGLNFEDPNKFYDGEPEEITIDLNDKMIEHFSRLTLRLLNLWRERKNELENKDYLTDKDKEEFFQLKNLVWPLEAAFNNSSLLLAKYKDKEPLKFPGEGQSKDLAIQINTTTADNGPILFPTELLDKLPEDIQKLCLEFNFNFKNHKENACVLLLRRILPLSIVRKFQRLDKESEIIEDGDYLDTKQLLGKAEKILKSKRLYDEIRNYKVLLDGSQHSYTLNVTLIDAEGAGVKLRLLLEDLFQ